MLEKFEGEKRKQWMYLAIAIGLTMGAVLFFSYLSSNDKNEQVKKELPKVKIVDTKKVEEEPFKKIYGKKIGLLEEEIKQLKRELKMMNEIFKDRQINNYYPNITGEFNENIIKSPVKEEKETNAGLRITSSNEVSNMDTTVIHTQNSQNNNQNSSQVQKQISVQVLDNLIALEGNTDSNINTNTQKLEQKREEDNTTQSQSNAKNKVEKTVENTIPAGSFVKAVLLSGLDAPTSGNAVRNPHPVLFKLTNKAILPNKWKINIKDCFVIGTGYGDLSSERAYIRLERLTCTKNDGSIISKTVEGYVSGEDGKNGLKGRVVSKQGALLARTLLAGFLQGVAQAFSQQSQQLLISPQGAVQTVNPNQAFQYAGVIGVSEATKKLADFYMNLVNKTFPVIEILPGRKVDIVFLKDVKLEG